MLLPDDDLYSFFQIQATQFLADAGVRDMESYNSIVESHEEGGKKLPRVVVIIDELADLMLVAAK